MVATVSGVQPGTRRRILVATPDVLADAMAGPAIRAWHIAEELSTRHDVRLISTGACSISSDRFEVSYAKREQAAAHARWAEIVIFQGWFLTHHPEIAEMDVVLVADVYDPMHLEQLEQASGLSPRGWAGAVIGATAALSRQLARADFVICASEDQRMLWLGHLAALGRINPELYSADPTYRSFVDVVPFGCDPEFPPVTRHAIRGVVPGIGQNDLVLLWNGGVYNWFDPLTLVRAMALVARTDPGVRLVFMGMKHPNPGVPEMRVAAETVALAEELDLRDRTVFFNFDWVPYADRHEHLADADLTVSTHQPGLETDFAFRTRVLDSLWAGLPTIVTEGGALSDLVAIKGLGAVVPPGDEAALADAIGSFARDPELLSAARVRVAEVAREFTWPVVLQPLVRFCDAPRRAPDLVNGTVADDRRYDLGIGFWVRRRPGRLIRLIYLIDRGRLRASLDRLTGRHR